METKTFSIRVYTIDYSTTERQTKFFNYTTNNLSDVIDHVNMLDLPDKYLEMGNKSYRLEDVKKNPDGSYLLNFAIGEYSGPGKSNYEEKTTPILIKSSERYSHEIAALYDPTKEPELFYLESSKYGNLGIKNYLKYYSNPEIVCDMLPLIETTAAAKVRNFNKVSKIHVKGSLAEVSNADIQNNVGLLHGLLQDGFGAANIDMIITIEKEEQTLVQKIKRMANAFERTHKQTNKISKIELTGKELDDEKAMAIDILLPQHLREEELKVSDERKIILQHKWDVLMRYRI